MTPAYSTRQSIIIRRNNMSIDFYSQIHKALRRCLYLLATETAATDFTAMHAMTYANGYPDSGIFSVLMRSMKKRIFILLSAKNSRRQRKKWIKRISHSNVNSAASSSTVRIYSSLIRQKPETVLD